MTEPGISAAKLLPLAAAKAAALIASAQKPLSFAVGAHFAAYGELRCPRTKTPPAPPHLRCGELLSLVSCRFVGFVSSLASPPFSFSAYRFYSFVLVLFAFLLPILSVDYSRHAVHENAHGYSLQFLYLFLFSSLLLLYLFFVSSIHFRLPSTPTSHSLQPWHTDTQFGCAMESRRVVTMRQTASLKACYVYPLCLPFRL